MKLFLSLLFICYQPLLAGTWVRDILFNPDGSLAAGNIFVTNSIRFLAITGRQVAAQTQQFTIRNGRLSIQLEPNIGSIPSGTSYFVRYELGDDRVPFSEFWVIPNSVLDQQIIDVAVGIIPTSSMLLLLTQLSTSGAFSGQVIIFDGANAIWGTGDGSGITCNSPTTLTIVAGLIAIPSTGCYLVATEGAASIDDVDTVTCPVSVHFILMAADGTQTVIIRDNGSNMDLSGSFALDDTKDQFFGRCDNTNLITEKGRVHIP